MPATLIKTCPLCGLRFSNLPLLELHIREDHPRQERRPERDNDNPADTSDPAGKAGITIRRMSRNDIGAACKVLGLAFADNPNTLVIARGDRARGQRMMESGARFAKLGRRYSHVLVAEDMGRVVGVLNAIEWPNCQLRMNEKLKIAPSMIRVTGLGLPRAFTMMSVWAKHDPRKRHWHVGPIGVHPERQGGGVGKALLAAFLDMADAQGSPAYLETDADRNVALYEKFGFKAIEQEDISGVNNRFMWREAGARSPVPGHS